MNWPNILLGALILLTVVAGIGWASDTWGQAPPPSSPDNPCAESFDGDMEIDTADIALLVAHFGEVHPIPYQFDLSQPPNGAVDTADITMLTSVFGFHCDGGSGEVGGAGNGPMSAAIASEAASIGASCIWKVSHLGNRLAQGDFRSITVRLWVYCNNSVTTDPLAQRLTCAPQIWQDGPPPDDYYEQMVWATDSRTVPGQWCGMTVQTQPIRKWVMLSNRAWWQYVVNGQLAQDAILQDEFPFMLF